MVSSGSPFRTSPETCQLCGVEVGSDRLRTVSTLKACEQCTSGDLGAALRRWSFEEQHRQWIEPKSPDNSENKNLSVEVTRPTSLDLHATLSGETTTDKIKTFFGRGDPKVGERSFDDRVKIDVELDFEPLLMGFLEEEGARAAIADLVALGCTVDLGNQVVSANIRNWIARSLPDLTQVLLATFVLAVHLELFAQPAAR